MGDRIKIRLVSTGKNAKGKKTGTFTTKTKSNKPKPGGEKREKEKTMRYDPRAINEKTGKQGAHVLFVEEKIK